LAAAGKVAAPRGSRPLLYCAAIVKTVDAQTRAKTGISELFRRSARWKSDGRDSRLDRAARAHQRRQTRKILPPALRKPNGFSSATNGEEANAGEANDHERPGGGLGNALDECCATARQQG
jgi:hypothetical protein